MTQGIDDQGRPNEGADYTGPRPDTKGESQIAVPLVDPEAFTGIMRDCGNAGINEPRIYQDGGHEIHPELKGITFKFWFPPEGSRYYQKCAVIFEGNAISRIGQGIQHKFTGLVFSGFDSAKQYLRETAARLVAEEKERERRQGDEAEANKIRKKLGL